MRVRGVCAAVFFFAFVVLLPACDDDTVAPDTGQDQEPVVASGSLAIEIEPVTFPVDWTLTQADTLVASGAGDSLLTGLAVGDYTFGFDAVPEGFEPRGDGPGVYAVAENDTVVVSARFVTVWRVAAGTNQELSVDTFVFDEIHVDGVLTFFSTTQDTVVFDADVFTIGPDGRVDARNWIEDGRGSRSWSVVVRARESVRIDGRLESNGIVEAGSVGGGAAISIVRGGGSILVESDTIEVTGTVRANGDTGFCAYDDLFREYFQVGSSAAGSITLRHGDSITVTGTLQARGAAGTQGCRDGACDGGTGSNGGKITFEPPASLPDATIDVAGGPGGAPSPNTDTCPGEPGEAGATGTVVGRLR